MVSRRRQTHLVATVFKQIILTRFIPDRHMGMAPIARKIRKRLRHKRCTQPVLLGNCLYHIFKEHVSIRCHEGIVIVPVHFKLAVGILMIVLIRSPAQLNHTVADFTDHVVLPHKCRLIVTGLLLSII